MWEIQNIFRFKKIWISRKKTVFARYGSIFPIFYQSFTSLMRYLINISLFKGYLGVETTVNVIILQKSKCIRKIQLRIDAQIMKTCNIIIMKLTSNFFLVFSKLQRGLSAYASFSKTTFSIKNCTYFMRIIWFRILTSKQLKLSL